MAQIVKIGNLILGGGHRILVQSMTNTNTADSNATALQVQALADAGCDIVRIAVSSKAEIDACKHLLQYAPVPLVADIQYDYKLAVQAADAGFSKIRFNPGNIGGDNAVKEVVAACKRNAVPIRIGVNSGSLEQDIEQRIGRTAEALCESAMRHVTALERQGFTDIVLSVKASNVITMIQANRLLAQKTQYPLHLGVTESGLKEYGLTKSAIGIGSLLADGIGDTIRVSLTGDPLSEITAAKLILRAVGKLDEGAEIVSCPTCSRCKTNLSAVADEMTTYVQDIKQPIKIAVMGCAVNGPGEAKDADFGVAYGAEKSIIFQKGQILRTVPNTEVLPLLKRLADEYRE